MKMGGQALHLITSVNSLCIEKETQENTNTITPHTFFENTYTTTKHKIKEPKKWGDDSYIWLALCTPLS